MNPATLPGLRAELMCPPCVGLAADTAEAVKKFRHPNNIGNSQFHRCITSPPPIAMKTAIPMIASGATQISFFLMLCPSFFLNSSPLPKLVVNALQPFAQMQHRVALARE